MKKRGQVAIFVIIAIVIVGLVIGFVLLRNKNLKAEGDVPPEALPVYDFVKECIKQTAEAAVIVVGSKGGYYFSPSESIITGEGYYAINGKSITPKKSTIEYQISRFVEENIPDCINKFRDFPDYRITSKNMTVESRLKEDRVSVNVNYLITIKKGESTSEIADFNVDVLTRVNLLYNIAGNYSSLFIESEGVSLTYASEIEDTYNITSNFRHYSNYTLVSLTDSKGINGNEDYQWRFVLG